MANRRLQTGPAGSGRVAVRVLASGRYAARCRVRDSDGALRSVEATGDSDDAAREALANKLNARTGPPIRRPKRGKLPVPANDDLQTDIECIEADTLMRDAIAVWLMEVNQDPDRRPQTRQFYRHVARQTLLPEFGRKKVSELTPGIIDKYLKKLTRTTPTQARNARKVLRMVLMTCVLDGAIPMNPVLSVPRQKPGKPRPVRALDAAGFNQMRALLAAWRTESTGKNGAPRDPSFAATDAIEVMIGTGLRIGEVLALRPADLNLDAEVPGLIVTGTLIEVAGAGGVQRQPFPKSQESVRKITLPAFVVRALRRQMELNGSPDLVFTSGTGRCISPGNIRRAWREARHGSDLEWVTPHTLRRSVATILEGSVNIDAAAQQLGHADSRVTEAHYIEKHRQTADNAALLEGLLSPDVMANVASESGE